MDDTLKCDHSNQSYGAVLYPGAVHYAVQGVSNISESTHKILFVLVSLEMKTIKHLIPVMLNKKVRSFESVNEILKRDLLNESY